MTPAALPLVPVAGVRSAEERRAARARARGVGGLPSAVADWPEEWREVWEERAAIMTFVGCLPVALAEQRAEERVRLEHARVLGLESEQESSAETASLSP